MPREEYEKDFNSDDSIKEFRELCAKAYKCFELSLAEGTNPADLGDHSKRDLQYHKVGLYVAKNSQILFALWDGIDTGKQAGTSQIVKYKLDGIPEGDIPELMHFDYPGTGVVYHVVTPRKSNPIPRGKKYDVIKLSPIERIDSNKLIQINKRLPKGTTISAI